MVARIVENLSPSGSVNQIFPLVQEQVPNPAQNLDPNLRIQLQAQQALFQAQIDQVNRQMAERQRLIDPHDLDLWNRHAALEARIARTNKEITWLWLGIVTMGGAAFFCSSACAFHYFDPKVYSPAQRAWSSLAMGVVATSVMFVGINCFVHVLKVAPDIWEYSLPLLVAASEASKWAWNVGMRNVNVIRARVNEAFYGPR